MSRIYKGIIASKGIVMGPCYNYEKVEVKLENEKIDASEVSKEHKKILDAIDKYEFELNNREVRSKQEELITNAHIELLKDPYLKDTILDKITRDLKKSDWALRETIDEMVFAINSLDDPYLKERATDYKDIGDQIMYALKGIKVKNLSSLDKSYIIISRELTPSDTSTMDRNRVLGFATDLGGKTSHVSIIAQTMDIPALVGVTNISKSIKNDEYIIIDGFKGEVIADPTIDVIKEYKNRIEKINKEKERLDKIKSKEAKTIDGRVCEVAANIGNLEDLDIAIKSGCDGVGLFRTEFLYMENTNFPTEEEQFLIYKKACEKLDGKPLIIRTLDIGGDKGLDYFDFPIEENPFLGYRAIRLCLDKLDVFRTQLRAILRASYFGKIRIMLPMVINIDEIKKSRKLLEDIKESLDKENILYDKNIELGIMVETPASVLMAKDLIKYSDFFSIGTNDLTQYILAVDRGNENISSLYNTYNPAVLRAIKTVIDVSHENGKWTGMCGQFATDTSATKLLLGLGLDEFSGSASSLSKVKDIILNSSYENERDFSNYILSLETPEEIEEEIAKHNAK